MEITFKPMTNEHLSLWQNWIQKPHVKDVWFIEGYETSDYIHEKIRGNGFDYPFISYLNQNPLGFIQCCDLYIYRTTCETPKGVFLHESPGTFCIDLFIGDEENLNKGFGTLIVRAFSTYVFNNFAANKILIDPAISNKRAIATYEKAGYKFIKIANDGVTDCYILGIDKETFMKKST